MDDRRSISPATVHMKISKTRILIASATNSGKRENQKPRNMDEWKPIKDAPHIPGREIIGIIVGGSDPFTSFWSPTLNRFYREPTHYIDFPSFPKQKESE